MNSQLHFDELKDLVVECINFETIELDYESFQVYVANSEADFVQHLLRSNDLDLISILHFFDQVDASTIQSLILARIEAI